MANNIDTIKNPRLVAAIEQMNKEKTKEAQNRMIFETMQAYFLCPVTIVEKNQVPAALLKDEQERPVCIHMIQNQQGESFFVAFTSKEEMLKWNKNPGQKYTMMRFVDYVALIMEKDSVAKGLVIDPLGVSVTYSKEMIQMILKQLEANAPANKQKQKIVYGEPKEYPATLVEHITSLLKTKENVISAYFSQLFRDEYKRYILVVEYDNKNTKELFDEIGKTAVPFLNDYLLDIVSASDDLGDEIVRHSKAFYKK